MKIHPIKYNQLLLLLVCLILISSCMTYVDGAPLNLPEEEQQPPTIKSFSVVGTVIKLFFSLGLIIVLAILLSRFFNKRILNLAQGKHMTLLDHLALGNNRAIYIVDVAGEVLVLACAENSVHLISKVEDMQMIEVLRKDGEASGDIAPSFTNYLQSFRDNIKRGEKSDLSTSLFLQQQIQRLKNISGRRENTQDSLWQTNDKEPDKDERYER